MLHEDESCKWQPSCKNAHIMHDRGTGQWLASTLLSRPKSPPPTLLYLTSRPHLLTSSAAHNMRYLVPRLYDVSRRFGRETSCMARKPQYKFTLRCNDEKIPIPATKSCRRQFLSRRNSYRTSLGKGILFTCLRLHRFRYRHSHAVQPSPWASHLKPPLPSTHKPKNHMKICLETLNYYSVNINIKISNHQIH